MPETVQISKVDAFGALIPWAGEHPNGRDQIGLNLGAGTFAASDSRDSNIIKVMMPCKLLVYLRATGTDVTVKVDKFDEDASANFGSPDLTFSLSGAADDFKMLSLAAGEVFQVRASSSAGGVIAEAIFLPVQQGDFEYRNLSGAMNAVKSTASAPSFLVDA